MLTDGLSFLHTAPQADILKPAAGSAYPSNPQQGQMFFNTTLGIPAVYSGTAWLPLSADKSYDISLFVEGKPTANALLLSFAAPRAYSLPANLTGSLAKAGTAATAQTRFTLKKNATQIGTITFEAGATSGVLVGTATSFAVGDILTISAEEVPDSTLENISISLTATLA